MCQYKAPASIEETGGVFTEWLHNFTAIYAKIIIPKMTCIKWKAVVKKYKVKNVLVEIS
jgi:hypothetical protein